MKTATETSRKAFERRFTPGKSRVLGEFNHHIAIIKYEIRIGSNVQMVYEKLVSNKIGEGFIGTEISRHEATEIIRREKLVLVLKETYGEVWDSPKKI